LDKILKIKNRKIKPDGYDPTTKTIYEFNGDYWHGNPNLYKSTDTNKHNKKTFEELYKKTIERESFLVKNGYKVVSIWESDFKPNV
jgi:G:T-mismatch repair DNA endonuclease (very short patch repair protein)